MHDRRPTECVGHVGIYGALAGLVVRHVDVVDEEAVAGRAGERREVEAEDAVGVGVAGEVDIEHFPCIGGADCSGSHNHGGVDVVLIGHLDDANRH